MSIPVRDIIQAGYGGKKEMMKLTNLKDSSLSGVNNQVYYDKSRNNAILNVKGTNPFSPQDIYTDAVLGIFGEKGLKNTARFKESKMTYDKIKQKYPQANITVTGHSLGSNLGQALVNKKQDKFIGINGYKEPFKPTPSYGEKFKHYRTSNDIVSGFTGNSKNIKTIGGFKNPFDILGNHSANSISKRIRV